MAVKLDGSTGYLEHAGKLFSGFPFSMMVWVSADSTGSYQMWMAQQQSNADRAAQLWLDANGVSKYATTRNPGNGSNANKATSPDPNATMRLAVAVYTSASSRTVYYGSNTGVTDTAALTDDTTNHDRVTVGALRYNSGSVLYPVNGSVAETHGFNVALTATDVANLLADTVKPEAISGWVDGWILKPSGAAGSAAPASFTSIGGTRTLTTVGGVTVSSLAHPISRNTSSFAGTLDLDGITVGGGYSTVPNGSFAGALTLDGITVGGGYSSQPGTFTSLPLRANNGVLLANKALNHVTLYDETTGAFVTRKTGLSTDASGVFTVQDALVLPGANYKADWLTATGERRMPKATAT